MKILKNRTINLLLAILFGVIGLGLLGLNCMLFISYNTVHWFFVGVCPLTLIAAFMFKDNEKSLKAGTGVKWS